MPDFFQVVINYMLEGLTLSQQTSTKILPGNQPHQSWVLKNQFHFHSDDRDKAGEKTLAVNTN